VNICLDKLFIQEDCPLSIINLSGTMGHECTVESLPTNTLRCKSFKGIWELSKMKFGPAEHIIKRPVLTLSKYAICSNA
jgi:hypothetical protein